MKYQLRITQDPNASNPRDWDSNYCLMYCDHRRYKLGDDLPKYSQASSWEGVKQLIINQYDPAVILPISLYDHTNLAMSVGVHNGWDCGQVGFIFVPFTIAKGLFSTDTFTEAQSDMLASYAEKEVETYSQYLAGDVYQMEIFEITACDCCGTTKEEMIESIGGFYGSDPATNGMADYLTKPLEEYTILRE